MPEGKKSGLGVLNVIPLKDCIRCHIISVLNKFSSSAVVLLDRGYRNRVGTLRRNISDAFLPQRDVSLQSVIPKITAT